MTVDSENARNGFIGNDTTPTFAYNFRIFLDSDLRVTQRNVSTAVETDLVLTTDYTVAGVGDLTGGTITLLAGDLATGQVLTIRRRLALLQNTDIKNAGDFLPETHEDQFDRGVMIAQSQQDEIDRSMHLPETIDPDVVSPELPVPVALNFIRWNAAATALENAISGDLGAVIIPGLSGIAVFTTPGTFSARNIVAGDGTIGVTNGDGQVGNPSIIVPAAGITETQINTSVAGNGLTGGGGTVLSVDPDSTTGVTVAPLSVVANGAGVTVDNSTIVHTAGTIAVPTGGIKAAQIDADAVTTVKILDANVTKPKLAAGITLPAELLFFDNSQTQFTVLNSVTATIFSETVDANTLGADGTLHFRMIIEDDVLNPSSGTITIALKLGGTTLVTVEIGFLSSAHTVIVEAMVVNMGATNAQYAFLTIHNGADNKVYTGSGAAAEDTTTDLTLAVDYRIVGDNNNIDMEYASAYVVK